MALSLIYMQAPREISHMKTRRAGSINWPARSVGSYEEALNLVLGIKSGLHWVVSSQPF